MNTRAEDTIAGLSQAIVSSKPLIDVLPEPIRLVIKDADAEAALLQRSLDRIAAVASTPRFQVRRDIPLSDLTIFEQVLSDRMPATDASFGDIGAISALHVKALVDGAIRGSFAHRYRKGQAMSFDGVPLNVYAAGKPSSKSVVLVSASGMPASLYETWLAFLSQEHFVVVWESRGLFCQREDQVRCDFRVTSQVEDLFSVMDYCEIPTAHVLAFCDAASLAISAAVQRPPRISSLSLWQGTYPLGPDCPKTSYEQNYRALMAMAAESRSEAKAIHKVLCRSVLTSGRRDLAHMTLYPYATADLLFGYASLHRSIMESDIYPLAAWVTQPTFVFTTEEDTVAHPEASRLVAGLIKSARLHVEPRGDHAGAFDGPLCAKNLALRFFNETHA